LADDRARKPWLPQVNHALEPILSDFQKFHVFASNQHQFLLASP